VEQSWCDQDPPLPHEVSVTLHSPELVLSGLVLADLSEQVAQFTVGIVFVVQILKQVDLVDDVSPEVCSHRVVVPLAVV
jgi:hypothetical protein